LRRVGGRKGEGRTKKQDNIVREKKKRKKEKANRYLLLAETSIFIS